MALASGVRVRAALLVREAKPMDKFLDLLRALGALASIIRLAFELWEKRRHNADDEGR